MFEKSRDGAWECAILTTVSENVTRSNAPKKTQRVRWTALATVVLAVAGLAACLPQGGGTDVGVLLSQRPSDAIAVGDGFQVVPAVQVRGEVRDVVVRVGIPAGVVVDGVESGVEFLDRATGDNVSRQADCRHDSATVTCTFAGTVPADAAVDRFEVRIAAHATTAGGHEFVATVGTGGTEASDATLANRASLVVDVRG